ncbi:ATP-binding cassette domain-containing protein [Sodalis sp. CWE]|uniref:ATP-binding cassette domain-containing protein n=1 Tax=Sodalis sp. CWE TaxID=2803816 RepID=UPI001C7D2BE2|nr:ATP-binding cassette domain-containing protein [Sodalis sp. CWE]MBX4180844.1 ATP-binding cassette domain-containing protein [Sodalis sp. CWE]
MATNRTNTNPSSNLVEIHELSFRWKNRVVFDRMNISFPRGKVTAIIGPSGVGKTTLLRLIGGQLPPCGGEIWINGDNIPTLSRRRLYEVRKKISMLFQSGALFTDDNVFENVAFPLRHHHARLPESILRSTVLMTLEVVGLRGAESVMPSELSGGMIRRVALARAIILEPELIMLDEPFVGHDPITVGVLSTLISNLNCSLGITCIVVSHDVPEVLKIADYSYIVAERHVVAEGTPDNLFKSQDPLVKQFLNGFPDGPISFNIPGVEDYQTHLLGKNN